MIEVFHVSDLHFGQSHHQEEKAMKLLEGINRLYPFKDNADRYLLVTGDFTQSGRDDEYQLALQALSPFQNKIFVTPGNHDYGSLLGMNYSEKKALHFDDPFAKMLGFGHPFIGKKVFSHHLKNVNDELLVIGLNSCAKVGVLDLAQGEVGENQRMELDQLLANSKEQMPKLVFLHHIPHKEADFDFVMTLRDRQELMAIVKDRVDALAFGHQGQDLAVNKKIKAVATARRPMQVRSLSISGGKGFTKGPRRRLILDADNSVAEQAFYYIQVENNSISATVEKI